MMPANRPRDRARFLLVLGTTCLPLIMMAAGREARASGPLLIDVIKQSAVNIKVWKTIFWVRVGDPIVDLDFDGGTHIQVKDDSEYTDRSVKQTRLTENGIALATNIGFGAVVPNTEVPGTVTMPEIGPYLEAKVGLDTPVPLPDLMGVASELHIAIDLETWINSGASPPGMGATVMVMGGLVPGLPGLYVGLVPQVWDPVFGVGNPAPYTGMTVAIGMMAVRVQAPEGCAGDADCDGGVNFFDIDSFVARLGCPGGDPVGCSTGCAWQNADVDGDGDVDFFDIDPFVARLGTICP